MGSNLAAGWLLMTFAACPVAAQVSSAGGHLSRFEYEETHMASPFHIVLYSTDETSARRASRAAFDRIATLNSILSDYDPESELSRLGHAAGGAPVSAGQLSFPADAAPGWMPFSDDQTPNLIGAVGIGQEVPGANQWMMQAEVAITNFVTSMDVSAQASKLTECVANGPGYANASPTLGPTKTSSITVDGVKAARVDADVTIADPSRNVKGDSLTIVAVDTKPVTIFMGATPIGDADSAATINQVIAALKVAK